MGSEQPKRLYFAGMTRDLKDSVREFWNEASCGEVYAIGTDLRERLENQARERSVLEPWIRPFANFPSALNRDVLEIGVGMGADHLEWAKALPRSLTGIDITDRAIRFTADRLRLYGLCSDLRVADAENLPFPDKSFDIIYSYGVLHHTPDTARAIQEVHRVLRPGGLAKIMIYHSRSLVGYMLWLRVRTSRTAALTRHLCPSPGESRDEGLHHRGSAVLIFVLFIHRRSDLSRARRSS